MPEKILSNTIGANQTVTALQGAFLFDDLGILLSGYQELVDGIAAGALAVGDVLTWVVPSTTVGPRLNKVASGGAGTFLGAFKVAGVCVKAAAAAGSPTQFVKYGLVKVQVGAGTPAIGDMAVSGVTAGQADVIAAATGATAGTFVGNVLGQFWSTKDANNLAVVWYNAF